ncbi:hypothetical protein [Microbaculum marinisediminis]|uniref:Uncharacterized protein n=1 Tax=Microbaculum marinisediminis TaxID=2931392 RepID=A0AAW5QYI0_9HYPH|nr:hypothetical protein [Microbaculum sp. A6E488]MCT8971969.1 hypothetical protein [Microbaculum sp. A6E488]
MTEKKQEAEAALSRVQKFDVQSLPQTERLGESLNFSDVVEPTKKVIQLFKQIPTSILSDFPDNKLDIILKQSNSFYNTLEEIANWSIENVGDGNAINNRNSLISRVTSFYQGAFDQLSPIIAYAASRTTDLNRLETEARASVQSIRDNTNQLIEDITSQSEQAQNLLEEIRKVAAEQGVSQEAIYFSNEANEHDSEAKKWRFWTLVFAATIASYAIAAVFVHKWPLLTPNNVYETIQLSISKIIIFSALGYLLILFSRNFMAHTHNKILNKHRQNSLMTYKTLANAAGNQENRDVVLLCAAECIFSPRDTGYTKSPGEQSTSSSPSIVNLLSRSIYTEETKS